jgi:Protein of unknown function (DUF2934)
MARSAGPKPDPKTKGETPPRRRSTRASQPSSVAPAESPPSRDEVQKRAYERYLERGGSDGADLDDWLEAERELEAARGNRFAD